MHARPLFLNIRRYRVRYLKSWDKIWKYADNPKSKIQFLAGPLRR